MDSDQAPSDLEAYLAQAAEAIGSGTLDTEGQFARITEVATRLQARWWVFILFTRSQWASKPIGRHHFLGNVPAEWLQRYAGRYWYLNDACLQYASHRTEPIRISDLIAETEGQRVIMAAAAAMGLREGILVPCYSSSPAIAGALKFYYDDPQTIDPAVLANHRTMLRAVATAILDRELIAVQRELRERARLTDQDLEILRLGDKGLSSREIAGLLSSKPRTVDRAFQRIATALALPGRARTQVIALMRDVNLL
jgi:DNA-binding CsgD family transcriptional regulator